MGCRGAVQKHNVWLVTASGEPIPVFKAAIRIGELFQPVQHDFLVVKNLISPGQKHKTQKHRVVLNISADPVVIHSSSIKTSIHQNTSSVSTTVGTDADDDSDDIGHECIIPSFEDDGTVILYLTVQTSV